ncbi:hypothetical protein DT536_01030 [Acinetobacter johnsonii]|nr:hypothetical protein DT536_01030 [Acinetobacter johnsonii]
MGQSNYKNSDLLMSKVAVHLSPSQQKNQIRKVDIQEIKQFLSFMTSPVIFISYFHLSID